MLNKIFPSFLFWIVFNHVLNCEIKELWNNCLFLNPFFSFVLLIFNHQFLMLLVLVFFFIKFSKLLFPHSFAKKKQNHACLLTFSTHLVMPLCRVPKDHIMATDGAAEANYRDIYSCFHSGLVSSGRRRRRALFLFTPGFFSPHSSIHSSLLVCSCYAFFRECSWLVELRFHDLKNFTQLFAVKYIWKAKIFIIVFVSEVLCRKWII